MKAEQMKLSTLKNPSNIVMCDTETTGLDAHRLIMPCRPFAFSFTTFEGVDSYYRFNVNPHTRKVEYMKDPESFAKLVKIYGDPTTTKVFHNANFDLLMLEMAGIKVAGPIFDTLTMLHVFKNNLIKYGLKPVCKTLFDIDDEDEQALADSVKVARRKAKKNKWAITKDGKDPWKGDYHLADLELCKIYAVRDTQRTNALFHPMWEEYNNNPVYKELVDVEMRLAQVLYKMNMRGSLVDPQRIVELNKYYHDIIEEQKEIKADLGFKDLNPGSAPQMRDVFYNQLGMEKHYKVRKKKGSTEKLKTLTLDSETLSKFEDKHPLAKCLIVLSTAQNQIDDFLVPLKRMAYNNILHPNFRVGPITGRLSCSEPNLMNITSPESPKKRTDEVDYLLRSIFIPRKNMGLYFPDYSQIEVWLAAFLSQDPVLMDALLSGKDMHTITCKALFGMRPDYEKEFKKYRKLAKIVNFAIQYGGGAGAVSIQAQCSYQEAQDMIAKYWGLYSGLKRWCDSRSREARETGSITNVFGRIYHFDQEFCYKAPNTDIQGTAAEIIKRAMINVDDLFEDPLFKDKTFLNLTIHDELGIEYGNGINEKLLYRAVIRQMQAEFHKLCKLPFPFKVGPAIAPKNWFDKIELDPVTLEPVK